MTFGDFQTLVKNYGMYHGQAYIDHNTQPGEFRDACNFAIREYCSRGRLLYDDSVTMTLTAGTATYSLRDTDVFSKEMLFVDHIRVDNISLEGPFRFGQFEQAYPQFRDASNGQPRLWVAVTPDTIRLYPPPDSAYTTYVSGWYLPAHIENDNDSIPIPEEHHHSAAKLAALRILEVSMSTATAPVILALRQDVEASFRNAKSDASIQHGADMVRGRMNSIVITF